MMRIAHLSDLHFGADDAGVAERLAVSLRDIKPELVIVSGDFTQGGRRKEFERAGVFLRSLSCPYLCVPGNHDVPAHNIIQRLIKPYGRYSEVIGPPEPPVFKNDKVTIVGINSARRALPHWNWANGAVSDSQRRYLGRVFINESPLPWRIVVMHHPVNKDMAMPIAVTVFGRKRTLRTFRELEVDLVLTGHTHMSGVTTIGDAEHSTIYLSASTAMSTRRRGRNNGFNVVDVKPDTLFIRHMEMVDGSFETVMTHQHRRRKG